MDTGFLLTWSSHQHRDLKRYHRESIKLALEYPETQVNPIDECNHRSLEKTKEKRNVLKPSNRGLFSKYLKGKI